MLVGRLVGSGLSALRELNVGGENRNAKGVRIGFAEGRVWGDAGERIGIAAESERGLRQGGDGSRGRANKGVSRHVVRERLPGRYKRLPGPRRAPPPPGRRASCMTIRAAPSRIFGHSPTKLIPPWLRPN